MIINDNLAPLTEEIARLYWQDDVNVGRINRIIQYILERDAAQQGIQRIGGESAADKVVREMAESFIKFVDGDSANR